MEREIQGERTITVATDTFAPCGTIPGTATYPEPSQAEWDAKSKADRVLFSELRREFKWTADQVDHAIAAHGFPRPVGRTTPAVYGLGEPVYSRSAIRAWHETLQTFMRSVPTKLWK